MEQDHPNWVEQYAKCDIYRLIADLYKHIIQDIENRKEIAVMEEEAIGFRHESDRISYIMVARTGTSEDEKKCEFRMNGFDIQVRIEDPIRSYTISTKWDEEAIQCKVILKGVKPETKVERPHNQLWKIVHTILRPFLFPRSTISTSS